MSTRALNCASLLFLTMSRFQPGGSAEKATILAFLTQPTTEGPTGVVANHTALRKWEGLFRRCKELRLQIPDPSLLVRALDMLGKVIGLIGNKSPTAGWRPYSLRHQHHLDAGTKMQGNCDKGTWLLFFGMEHPEDPVEYLSDLRLRTFRVWHRSRPGLRSGHSLREMACILSPRHAWPLRSETHKSYILWLLVGTLAFAEGSKS